jgi:uncharacterized OB-fold protein
MSDSVAKSGSLRPVRDHLFVGDFSTLKSVHLVGSQCSGCGETSMGSADRCPNCGSPDVSHVPLSDRGVLWTFTVVRHRPPGDYRGPEPFAPFGVGLVELPEGVRVMARLDGQIDELKVGLPMQFRAYYREDSQESTVLTFSYAPYEGKH